MLHSCGQTHLQLKLNSGEGFNIDAEDIESYVPPSFSSSSCKLYTAYLGEVNVEVSKNGETVSLEKYHTINNKKILVKVVDSQEHNLSEKRKYSLNKLKSLSSHKINLSDSKYYYVLTLLCNKKIAQLNNNNVLVKKLENELKSLLDSTIVSRVQKNIPELISNSVEKTLTEYKKIYQKVVKYNSPVDVFFNTINYLDFLYKSTQLVSVNNLDSLVSISNVPNLDNAFFTGEYMVYGAGNKSFYPLSSLDVVGHELSHGLVSGTADLEYKGHSGALNESFADIMGTMFEFYMYDKYPHLGGQKDWLIGEDLGMSRPFLRSMSDPKQGNQPDKYKGEHYLNPNSQMDFGGVHINSGIPNYCFYLACQEQDKNKVLETFMKCLKTLNKKSNFINFRDTIKHVSNNDPILMSALNKVGLNDTVVSDYNPNNKNNFPKPKPECRHCPTHCPTNNKTPDIPQPPQHYPYPQPPQPYPYPQPPQHYPYPQPPQHYPYPYPYPRIPPRNYPYPRRMYDEY
jgi:hypothetical protein